MNELKVTDCVQLANGYSPKMTISKIEGEMATCVWFDSHSRKMVTDILPLSVLKKHQPSNIDIGSMFA